MGPAVLYIGYGIEVGSHVSDSVHDDASHHRIGNSDKFLS